MRCSASESRLTKTAPVTFVLRKSKNSKSSTRIQHFEQQQKDHLASMQSSQQVPLILKAQQPQIAKIGMAAGLKTPVDRWEGIGGLLRIASSKTPKIGLQAPDQQFQVNKLHSRKFVGLDSTGTKGVVIEYRTAMNVITGRPILRPSSSLIRVKSGVPGPTPANSEGLFGPRNIISWSPVRPFTSAGSPKLRRARPCGDRLDPSQVPKGQSFDLITGRVLGLH